MEQSMYIHSDTKYIFKCFITRNNIAEQSYNQHSMKYHIFELLILVFQLHAHVNSQGIYLELTVNHSFLLY